MAVIIKTKTTADAEIESPKAKAATKAKVQMVDEEGKFPLAIRNAVDRMGVLASQMEELEVLKKEYESAKKLVVEYVDDKFDPSQSIGVQGDSFGVIVKANAQKRTVEDVASVLEFMGPETFCKTVTVPLKAIDDYLTEAEKLKVLKIEPHGGSRSCSKPTEF